MSRRQSNNQWSGGIAAHPASKLSSAKIIWKTFASIFWDQDSILPIDYFSKGQTINAEYYSSLLVQLKYILEEKCRGKFTNGVLILHNTPAHRALANQKKLAYLGFHCLDHPSCSPNLAPSDHHGFPGLKNNWKFAIFLPTLRSLLPRRPGWTDILIFFEWLTKVRATD